jgi:hypothetical protein
MSAPPTFDDLFPKILEDAKARRGLSTHYQDAINVLRGDAPPQYALFSAPLEDQTQYGYQRTKMGNMFYHRSDAVVGFIADTDATFDIVLDNEGYWNDPILKVFPVSMKAGEFRLAWRGKGIIPGIRIVHSSLWIQNLRGSVREVAVQLEQEVRRELVQRNVYALDEEWTTSAGMVSQDPKRVL